MEGGTLSSILHSSRPSGTLRCSNSKAKQFSVSCTCPEDKQPLSPPLPPFLSCFFCYSFPILSFPFLWYASLSFQSFPSAIPFLSSPLLSVNFLSFAPLISYPLSSLPFYPLIFYITHTLYQFSQNFLSFPSPSASHNNVPNFLCSGGCLIQLHK